MEPADETLRALLERCREDHRKWINGDASSYPLPEDGTIFGAVGAFARGGPETLSRQVAVARQWESGHGHVEFANGAVSGDVAWLAFVERATVVFEGLKGEHRWDLRVTEVFRRVGPEWERVHRHADPLVERRSVQEAAALLA